MKLTQEMRSSNAFLEKIAAMQLQELHHLIQLFRNDIFPHIPNPTTLRSEDFAHEYRQLIAFIDTSCNANLQSYTPYLDAIFSRWCELTRHNITTIRASVRTGFDKFPGRSCGYSPRNRHFAYRRSGKERRQRIKKFFGGSSANARADGES